MNRSLTMYAALCAGAMACGGNGNGSTATSTDSGGTVGGFTAGLSSTSSTSSSGSTTSHAATSTGSTTSHATTSSTTGATTHSTTGSSSGTTAATTGSTTSHASTGSSTGTTSSSTGTTTSHASTGSSIGSTSGGSIGTTTHATSGGTSTGVTTTGGTTTGSSSTGSSSTGSSSTGSSSTGSSSTGSTTGGTTGGACMSEFASIQGAGTTCASDADCDCTLVCVADPAFASGSVCEYPCDTNANCSNVASLCKLNPTNTGALVDAGAVSVCVLNACASGSAVSGDACDAVGDGGVTGTCVPQSQSGITDVLICLPNGTGVGCANGTDVGTNNEDPLYSLNFGSGLVVASPFTRDSAQFCSSGQACAYNLSENDGGLGDCAALCVPGTSSCASGHCVSLDPTDQSWGFCAACAPGGAACAQDTDCCDSTAGNCDTTNGFCTL